MKLMEEQRDERRGRKIKSKIVSLSHLILLVFLFLHLLSYYLFFLIQIVYPLPPLFFGPPISIPVNVFIQR